MNGSTYLEKLLEEGVNTFTFDEAMKALDSSEQAARQVIQRLKRSGKVASPYRKFFVIVPPEYKSNTCPPAFDFIPQLMSYLGLPYYAALLSAGEYHGAAHHRPQVFQVMTSEALRSISCGRIQVDFHVRKNVKRMPIIEKNTKWGYIEVSSPETTAIDLVGYHLASGGIDNVANILSEMAEDNLLDPAALLKVSRLSPLPWAQRLGFVLCYLGFEEITEKLARFVQKQATRVTPLVPHQSMTGSKRDKKWKVAINAKIEVDV